MCATKESLLSKGLHFLTSNWVAFGLSVGTSVGGRLQSSSLTYEPRITLSGGLVHRAPESHQLAQGSGPPASSTGRASFAISLSSGGSPAGAPSSSNEQTSRASPSKVGRTHQELTLENPRKLLLGLSEPPQQERLSSGPSELGVVSS